MQKNSIKPLSVLDQLKQINKYKQEFWSSHELADALGYTNYRSFSSVIRKAKLSCSNSGYEIADHFDNAIERIVDDIGNKNSRTTLHLSRYACYLVIQNANPHKLWVALGQTYFATQARKQELWEQGDLTELTVEEQSRILLRNEITRHNKHLAELARRAGVIDPNDFSAFQNQGYMGLYGGLDREHLHKKKGLRKNQKVLDYMGSTELAANLFRATQTEEKLKRDNIKGKLLAYKIHFDIGQKVRQTIAELGGAMPEDLPTPMKSVKYIERKKSRSNDKDVYQQFLGEKEH